MKNFVQTAWIIIAFTMLANYGCSNKPSTPDADGPLTSLQQQVDDDLAAYHELEAQDFANLRASFIDIDSKLDAVKPEKVQGYFETLNLTQAYLQQFMEMKSSLRRKLDYSKQQLVDLQFDLEHDKINDSLFNVYLERESIAADTLHHQIRYFKERFGACQKELDALK